MILSFQSIFPFTNSLLRKAFILTKTIPPFTSLFGNTFIFTLSISFPTLLRKAPIFPTTAFPFPYFLRETFILFTSSRVHRGNHIFIFLTSPRVQRGDHIFLCFFYKASRKCMSSFMFSNIWGIILSSRLRDHVYVSDVLLAPRLCLILFTSFPHVFSYPKKLFNKIIKFICHFMRKLSLIL